jgi:hypothetical protein
MDYAGFLTRKNRRIINTLGVKKKGEIVYSIRGLFNQMRGVCGAQKDGGQDVQGYAPQSNSATRLCVAAGLRDVTGAILQNVKGVDDNRRTSFCGRFSTITDVPVFAHLTPTTIAKYGMAFAALHHGWRCTAFLQWKPFREAWHAEITLEIFIFKP